MKQQRVLEWVSKVNASHEISPRTTTAAKRALIDCLSPEKGNLPKRPKVAEAHKLSGGSFYQADEVSKIGNLSHQV